MDKERMPISLDVWEDYRTIATTALISTKAIPHHTIIFIPFTFAAKNRKTLICKTSKNYQDTPVTVNRSDLLGTDSIWPQTSCWIQPIFMNFGVAAPIITWLKPSGKIQPPVLWGGDPSNHPTHSINCEIHTNVLPLKQQPNTARTIIC